MNGNNKQLLINLQQGVCETKDTATREVLVERRVVKDDSECCAKPTDAVLLDSMSIGSDECDSIFFTIVNNTAETQILRGGKPGQAGVYQKLQLTPDASNVAGVTADSGDGSGPQPNVLPWQGMNFITQDGILVTGWEITVNAGPAAQANQNITLVRQSANISDKCRTKRIRPACPECPQDSAPDTRLFKFCRLLDAYNHVDYPLLPGANVDIRIFYAGLATAKGIVACSGPNAGKVIAGVSQTAV